MVSPERSALLPTALAVDATHATHVYFAGAGDGCVSRVPTRGGSAEVLAMGFRKPCGVAAHDGNVFVTDCEAGTVTRIHRCTARPRPPHA